MSALIWFFAGLIVGAILGVGFMAAVSINKIPSELNEKGSTDV